ncbi:Calx-beta domain-containing protein [Candidatus Halobeggiatoa sp. HSG11]|nr:Calx-beta domain-containing protein [Candidatus Halobeggiatoa sp. HSG11]
MSIIRFKFISIILMVYVSNVWANVHYVKYDATGDNNGTSWTNAYTDLQSALNAANNSGNKIWVAKGIYKPTTTGSRAATFQLKNNVKIYGNYVGRVNVEGKEETDWSEPYTTLSCDIGIEGDSSDNCYNVITIENATRAYLRGFKITGGNANGSQKNGGGIYSVNSNLEMSRVNIIDNFAEENGGGMYNEDSNPILLAVKFIDNKATYGGGIYNDAESIPKIGDIESNLVRSVRFENNIATENGGGIYNADRSSHTIPSINYAIFIGNTAVDGSGLYNGANSLTALNNSLFSKNIATNNGVIYNKNNNLTINQITVNGNSKGMYNETSSITINNSILWNNGIEEIVDAGGATTVNSSIIQGGLSGGINSDPKFIDAANNKFNLAIGSPALDAGDNNEIPNFAYDLKGNTRKVHNQVDIGAYEVQAPIAKSIVRADNSPTNATEINYTVTFNEAVSGVTEADFKIATSGNVTASINPVGAASKVYAVKVSITGGDNGTVGLNLLDDDSIVNNYGIPLLDHDNDETKIGEVYTIDGLIPTASIITDFDPIIIKFNENVKNFTIADLSLTHDSSPISLTTATLTSSDNITWELGNLALTDGNYGLILSANNVTDEAGNALATDVTKTWQVSNLPTTPTGLTATVVSENQVTLIWTDNSDNETGFKVERFADNIANTTVTNYNDTGLNCGTTYTYKVKAVNAGGESASATVTTTTWACSSSSNTITLTIDGEGSGRVVNTSSGIDCDDSCKYDFDSTTNIELTPIADDNSKFSGWGGHSDCIDGEISMANNRLCTAHFQLKPAKLKVTITGQGVVSNTTNINCNSECDYTFNNGTEITVTPTPATGWKLDTWQCGTDGQLILDADTECEAVFVEISLPELNITVTGKGTVTGEGIDCGEDCSEPFAYGKEVTLTTTPDSGWHFFGWRGHCVNENIVMEDSNKYCKAIFTEGAAIENSETEITQDSSEPVNLTIIKTGQGTVTAQPVGNVCGNNCSQYDNGTQVKLTATPDKDWEFLGWQGDCDTNGYIVLNKTTKCDAIFTLVVENDEQINTGSVENSDKNVPDVSETTYSTDISNDLYATDLTNVFNNTSTDISNEVDTDNSNSGAITNENNSNNPDNSLETNSNEQTSSTEKTVSNLVQLSRSNYTIRESDKFITIVVHRIDNCSDKIKVEYFTQAETATANEDYLNKRGFLTWQHNDCKNKTFDINILDDSNWEDSETVTIGLLGNDHGKLTIIDDDEKQVILTDDTNENYQVNFGNIDLEAHSKINGKLTLNGESVGNIEGVVKHDNQELVIDISAMEKIFKNNGELILNDNRIGYIDGVINYETQELVVNISDVKKTVIDNDNLTDENNTEKSNQCKALRIDSNGQETDSDSCFVNKLIIDGVLRPNNIVLTRLETQSTRITSEILVAPEDVGKAAEIILIGKYIKAEDNKRKYTRDRQFWHIWDGHISSLPTAQYHPQLPEIVDIFVFEGDLSGLTGEFVVFASYRLKDGTIVSSSSEPLHFFIDSLNTN